MQANILLIDDDAGLCDLIANDLEARGHKTRRAHSAEDGLRLLSEDNFDVVVTDVNMGGMSGVDLDGRRIRNRSAPG